MRKHPEPGTPDTPNPQSREVECFLAYLLVLVKVHHRLREVKGLSVDSLIHIHHVIGTDFKMACRIVRFRDVAAVGGTIALRMLDLIAIEEVSIHLAKQLQTSLKLRLSNLLHIRGLGLTNGRNKGDVFALRRHAMSCRHAEYVDVVLPPNLILRKDNLSRRLVAWGDRVRKNRNASHHLLDSHAFVRKVGRIPNNELATSECWVSIFTLRDNPAGLVSIVYNLVHRLMEHVGSSIHCGKASKSLR
mmetsp:Transcript_18582/g.28913  ORF Transcript_18582/g.28913 Transcript_18582/m.28913 type:complete len:246 (+) Transcript_18582:131-868(+)